MKHHFLNKTALFSLFVLILLFVSGCAGGGNNNAAAPTIEVNIDPSLGTTEPVQAVDPVQPEPAVEQAEAEQPEEPTSSSTTDDGYPEPGEDSSPGYPVPEEVGSSEPPNPEREIDLVDQDTGSLGGVLIRELDNGGGFQPVVPLDLFLAEMLLDNNGDPIFIGKSEAAPAARLLDTGVFVFQGIPPNKYGLIIDLGFSQFPINGDDGNIRIIEVKPGEAIDLGQLIVELPN